MIRQRYLSRRFDEAAILATLAKLAFESEPSLDEGDYAVLAALRRSSEDWNLSIAETADRLSEYDDDQIAGLVNNVKGIMHEMEFVALENSDGDSVVASVFPDTNHRLTDVQMFDEATGQSWEVQLKATDNKSLIRDWMDANPDTEIYVTEELAEKMDIKSSGLSNDEITMRVEDFVDRMVDLSQVSDGSLWNYFPAFVAASSGIIVFELWRQYRVGKIPKDEFIKLSLKTLGLKGAKYAALISAMAVPGLNVIVGSYLLASFILHVSGAIEKLPKYKPFSHFSYN